MSENKEYEGWTNYDTWNVSLWINNEYGLYLGAVDFMRRYHGKNAYLDFVESCGLDVQKTPDDIAYKSDKLNYNELNDMMQDFKEKE